MKKTFDYKNLSKNWYKEWENKNYFIPDYKKTKSYCITIPPPNITGTLHMGHAFQCTLMDVLIRFYKMNNYKILWKMGTDHAGIATQILIEQKIKNNINIDKILYTNKWKKIANKKIKNQLKKLGCALNWKTNRFTLDKHFSYAVKTAFIKLYNDNLIYKTQKLVNWDTKLKTAISDLEVQHEENLCEIFYIKYELVNEKNKYITIATTRPETIFADVALAVNPNDIRYSNLKNKQVYVPLTKKIISIIAEDKVDINYGTGCLKITPGHDFLDFEISEKHKLPIINILTLDGKLNELVPNEYQNLTVEAARKKIKEHLKNLDLIEKIEIKKIKVPKADRSNSIIEPLITEQWYIKTLPLAVPVYDQIKNNKIKIFPIKWKKIFFNWLENIKDWCISRQIWWGHKIPIWYDKNKIEYTGYSSKYIIKKYKLDPNTVLEQDQNVLDTWFSSALWPFASLGWPKKNIEYNNMYPTNTLVTGFDIIFFWAIKMMMFGIKFTSKMPFKEIYIHGLIRDNLGNKMSKTKGNVLDPMDIINGITKENLIKKQTSNLLNEKTLTNVINYTKSQFPNGIESFGTDALRLAFCSIATDNIAIKLDLDKVKTYKSFCTKLWNAAIFIQNNTKQKIYIKNITCSYNKYIYYVWQTTKKEIKKNLKKRKFHLATEYIYNFFWNNFCNWHIECTKIILQEKKYNIETYSLNEKIFKELLKILHPFAPYITEEIWFNLKQKKNIFNEKYPKINNIYYLNIEKKIDYIKNTCSTIRTNKKKFPKNYTYIFLNNLKYKELTILEQNKKMIEKFTKINKLKLSLRSSLLIK